jgi:anti-sigma factor RsiW
VNCQNTRDLLNGYADGELDIVNHLAIEEHLSTCPACSRIYEDQKTLKAAMADASLYFNAPPDLRDRIRQAVGRSETDSPRAAGIWIWRLVPAVAAFAVIVILVLLFMRPGPATDDLLASEIVSGHVRSMMANHLTDVLSSDQHTVKPWFDGKLDFSPPVIDLAASGFPLVGGRLDYAGSRPVAALVYKRQQHFINLFVFPSNGNPDSGSQMSVRQGYNLIHWSRSGMTFWAVSDLNLQELQEFAQDIQK